MKHYGRIIDAILQSLLALIVAKTKTRSSLKNNKIIFNVPIKEININVKNVSKSH